jgi:hypothetical protein
LIVRTRLERALRADGLSPDALDLQAYADDSNEILDPESDRRPAIRG